MSFLSFFSTKLLILKNALEIGGYGEVALELVNIPFAFTTSQLLPSRTSFCSRCPRPGNCSSISCGRRDLSSETIPILKILLLYQSARLKRTYMSWLSCLDGPRLKMIW